MLLAGALAGIALVFSGVAMAQRSCGEKVISAWSHGTLGHNYAVGCYRSALRQLPADVRGYSSAADDIERAMLAAIRDDGKSPATAEQHGGRRGLSPGRLAVLAGASALVAASLVLVGLEQGSGHRSLPARVRRRVLHRPDRASTT